MTRNLTSIEEAKTKILNYLARYSPSKSSDPQGPNKYVIKTHAKAGSQPTILAAVDDLEKEGLIGPSYLDEKARGQKPSKHYNLKLRGLLRYLSDMRDSPDLDRAVGTALKNHSNLLPAISDVWPRLDRVKPLRAKKLIDELGYALKESQTSLERWSSEDFLRDFMIPFRREVFWSSHTRDFESVPILDLQWFHSLSEHEDLKKLMLSYTEKMVKRQIRKGNEIIKMFNLWSAAQSHVSAEDKVLLHSAMELFLENIRKLEAIVTENLLYREPLKALDNIEVTLWDSFRLGLRLESQREEGAVRVGIGGEILND
jgi:hypothetical protein